MKTLKLIIIPLLVLVLFSCGDNEPKQDHSDKVDISTFTIITEQYPYEDLITINLSTKDSIDYLELIRTHGDAENENILFTKGIKCGNSSDSTSCVEDFDSLNSFYGFGPNNCLPVYCAYYIKSNKVDDNELCTSVKDLKELLGEIDSESDAILMTFASGYFEIIAFKKVDLGYELLALKLVSDCEPVQVDRFHLLVNKNGEITKLGQEPHSVMEGACI